MREKKRMDVMEKEMEELKNKMCSLEKSMVQSNEHIENKFNAIEQQQAASNIDIKSMFGQLIAEIGTLKTSVASITSSGAVQGEEQRKKARVDSPAPMNN